MDRWINKVAVVTGANSGIGAAIVQRLANDKLIVVGLDLDIGNLVAISTDLKKDDKIIHAIKVDITIEEEVVKAFKWIKENIGSVHIQINSAGVVHHTSLIDGDVRMWKNIFDVNVVGLCSTTKQALKSMIDNNVLGHLIHINSYLGHINDVKSTLSIYSSSKHAITALTETLRKELCERGHRIKVTSISPGIVETKLLNQLMQTHPEIKIPNTLKPDDVVSCIVFALSMPPDVDVTELTVRPVGDYLNEA